MTTLRQPVIPSGVGCPEKPLRADARRNRERILKAARAVFGDHGIDAQIDDVAKRAKVGVGTVYRHFPTKEALLDALVRERFEEIAGYAADALRHEDAWEGFCELIWRAAERNAVDRAFCEVVAFTDQSRIVEETGLQAHIDTLMARAKAQGRLRADATQMDIPIMMAGCGSVMRIHPSPDIWRRYLTIMLDGLRAS
jgi:AcrR family transcriptional regulator